MDLTALRAAARRLEAAARVALFAALDGSLATLRRIRRGLERCGAFKTSFNQPWQDASVKTGRCIEDADRDEG
ncbi:hypothetical protein [Tistrella mobilis]|uniref:hypothetical protein n=1 Tax=Tistrella mobilis TaxID=171437 RepID=UPI003556B7B5